MSTVSYCTSDPGYLDDATCRPFMAAYCSNDSEMDYRFKWRGDTFTSPCRRYATLNSGTACDRNSYAPVVDGFVRRYFLQNPTHPITYPQQGSSVYDPTMVDIITACQDYPGGCDAVLGQVCNGFTRSQLQANPNAATLCGCFLSDQTYNAYQGSFGVDKICDPVCTLQSAVKPIDLSSPTCQAQRCGESICVIDNVTISLLAGSTAGNISFDQACSSCAGGGGGCQCVLSDISITSVQSSLGNISLTQACGGAARCFKSNASGIPQPVDCAALEPEAAPTAPAARVSVATIIFIIIALIILIIFIVIIVYLARRRDEPSRFPRGSPDAGLAPPPGAGRYDNYANPLPPPIPSF